MDETERAALERDTPAAPIEPSSCRALRNANRNGPAHNEPRESPPDRCNASSVWGRWTNFYPTTVGEPLQRYHRLGKELCHRITAVFDRCMQKESLPTRGRQIAIADRHAETSKPRRLVARKWCYPSQACHTPQTSLLEKGISSSSSSPQRALPAFSSRSTFPNVACYPQHHLAKGLLPDS